MGRDFDFKRRPKTRTVITPPKQTEQVASPANTVQPRRAKRLWPLNVLLIAAAVAGIIFYYQSLQSPSKTNISSTPTPGINGTLLDGKTTPTATTRAGASPTQSPIVDSQTKAIVQIYDGGGGSTAVDDIIARLAAAGITVENLQTAQFQYAKTYVYYRASFFAQAQKIAQLLPNRDVVLNTTVIEGVFDILIYTGKK